MKKSMTSDDMLALDGAFKRLLRAQAAVGRLADEGVEKTMTHGDRESWGNFTVRLAAGRAEADTAFDAAQGLYVSLISAATGD
jgi:hypothetical protein